MPMPYIQSDTYTNVNIYFICTINCNQCEIFDFRKWRQDANGSKVKNTTQLHLNYLQKYSMKMFSFKLTKILQSSINLLKSSLYKKENNSELIFWNQQVFVSNRQENTVFDSIPISFTIQMWCAAFLLKLIGSSCFKRNCCCVCVCVCTHQFGCIILYFIRHKSKYCAMFVGCLQFIFILMHTFEFLKKLNVSIRFLEVK